MITQKGTASGAVGGKGRRIPGTRAAVSRAPPHTAPRHLGGDRRLGGRRRSSPASQDQAQAQAPARPNVLVIETDDQTLESMRVMANVNSLIGDRGARFANNFVNHSLCCPSRATFLTGQYEHNHGVVGNVPPDGGFSRFNALHGRGQPRRLAPGRGLLHRHGRQVPERLREQPGGPGRMVGVVRGASASGRAERVQRLRLHAEPERHRGPVRPQSRRFQAGRADSKGASTSSTAERPGRSPSSSGSPTRPPTTAARTRTRSPPPTASTPRSRRPDTPTHSTPSRFQAARTSTRQTSPTSRPRSETNHDWTRMRSRTSGADTGASWNRCCRWTRGSRSSWMRLRPEGSSTTR